MLTPDEIAKLPSSKTGLRKVIEQLRADVGNLSKAVDDFKDSPMIGEIVGIKDRSEASENLNLAYRHLEDARMRLGKVIQAADGGKSILDR